MAAKNRALEPGQEAPDRELQFCDGTRGTLQQAWSHSPILLALTRHLGCAFCREQLVDLRNHYQQLQDQDVEVIAVTMSPLSETAALRERLQLPFPCVADPEREVYRAYEAPRGSIWQVIGPRIWLPAVRAVTRAGMGVPRGDLMQLHASFLISSDGVILMSHVPDFSSDQLNCGDVLGACPIETNGEI